MCEGVAKEIVLNGNACIDITLEPPIDSSLRDRYGVWRLARYLLSQLGHGGQECVRLYDTVDQS